MSQIYHKRGDTLRLTATWLDNTGFPVNLTGYTISSQVRAVGFVDTLVVTITDAVNGVFTVTSTASSTALWPITTGQASRVFCDIQFTTAGEVVSSDTFQIIVLEDITL